MTLKKKLCAGCNELTYIYKNIDGKKYCKSCTQKLEPTKAIKKISEKQKFKIVLKQTQIQADMQFYMSVWNERFFKILSNGEEVTLQSPRCEVCSRRLGYEPNLTFFHHILEKRNFPELRHHPDNIAILCSDCHNAYETMPDKVPTLVIKRENLLKTLKNQ